MLSAQGSGVNAGLGSRPAAPMMLRLPATRLLGRAPAAGAGTAGSSLAPRSRSCLVSAASTDASSTVVPKEQAELLVPHMELSAPEDLASYPFYSQYPLNRHAEWRRNTEKLSELWASPKARLVPLSGDKVLVQPHRGGGGSRPEGQQQPGAPPPPTLEPVLLQPAAEAAARFVDPAAPHIFLGVDEAGDGAPYFAAQVTDKEALVSALLAQAVAAAGAGPSPTAAETPGAAAGDTGSSSNSSSSSSSSKRAGPNWRSARVAGQDLGPTDAALLATASGLNAWHLANPYHSASGSPTAPAAGGFGRKCTTSGSSVWPRIDPAVIMLITTGAPAPPHKPATANTTTTSGSSGVSHSSSGHPAQQQPQHLRNDWCLLGRKAEWPAGRYSTLAGFLEIGEPLEAAVVRETQEESGVVVDPLSVVYHSSQPWPFPRSLMVGFYGSAQQPQGQPHKTGYDLLPTEGRRAAIDCGILQQEVEEYLLPSLPRVEVDTDELQDARWFHRSWLRACILQGQELPGRDGFHIPGPWSLAYRLIHGWLPGGSGHEWAGDQMPDVAIDEGVFKYVLLRLRDPEAIGDPRARKLLVWGDRRAAYHMDIFSQAKAKAAQLGLTVDVLGGGRIEHYPDQKVIHIYGYSGAFGPAPHEVTASIVRRWFPMYGNESITTSYEGY